ncbi:MAG: 50S ribosomal protein L6 [Clostridia bacterium]|nr:50S ribosomal protein L6 [Clostridia bacterium]
MSRIGRIPVKLLDGVTAEYKDNIVTVKGPLGQLQTKILNDRINVEIKDGEIHVTRMDDIKTSRAAHGMYRAIIANMVKGVKDGYSKGLVISGVGYKAAVSGNKLTMSLGYSHPIEVIAPEGIKFECPSITEIKVSGIDKELVGQVASDIRSKRKPEPYHGYGVRYSDEVILRKAGKANSKK